MTIAEHNTITTAIIDTSLFGVMDIPLSNNDYTVLIRRQKQKVSFGIKTCRFKMH